MNEFFINERLIHSPTELIKVVFFSINDTN
jgi:hypothetical protein